MSIRDSEIMRDCAALELAGYLRTMVVLGEIPTRHAEEVRQRVNEVCRTQGISQIKPAAEQVPA